MPRIAAVLSLLLLTSILGCSPSEPPPPPGVPDIPPGGRSLPEQSSDATDPQLWARNFS